MSASVFTGGSIIISITLRDCPDLSFVQTKALNTPFIFRYGRDNYGNWHWYTLYRANGKAAIRSKL